MSIYISVTSHNNDDLIEQNFTNLPKIIAGEELIISIIDNVGSSHLKNLCEQHGLNYFFDGKTRGYGGNNNKNFEILNPNDDDLFIVCNPDITLIVDQLDKLFEKVRLSDSGIYGIKVYESQDLSNHSSHNRNFPALLDPIISLVFKKKLFANDIDEFAHPDWIGGGFMIFKAFVFRELNGFNEDFFMYYEDVDVCRRAKKNNYKITYDPSFYLIHEAKRDGRKLFSKSFFWNLKSMIKYFIKYPTFRLITIRK